MEIDEHVAPPLCRRGIRPTNGISVMVNFVSRFFLLYRSINRNLIEISKPV